MAWKLAPAVLTANDLFEGDVVWRAAAGGWTRDPRSAAVFIEQSAAEAALAGASAAEVVGPYLVRTALDASGSPEPAHYRERIRTHGPTIAAAYGPRAAQTEG